MNSSLLKILSNLQGTNGISTYSSLTATTETTSTDESAPSFAMVMNRLYSNIDTAASRNITNSYGFSTPYNRISVNKSSQTSAQNSANTLITPNITAIANKIKKNKNSIVDMDSQIREYLLENYGGNAAEVIKNLSGVQNLPSQALAMQDMLFEQIVTKISTQVRTEMYSSYDSSDISNLYSDDTESNSSDSTSAVSESESNYDIF